MRRPGCRPKSNKKTKSSQTRSILSVKTRRIKPKRVKLPEQNLVSSKAVTFWFPQEVEMILKKAENTKLSAQLLTFRG